MKITKISDEAFSCKYHGFDYRITCDECQDKFKEISRVIKKTVEENEKLNK